MIYFMQPVDGGPVKIGHSGDVEARRGELSYRYDEQLVILATMEGGADREREIHARFAHLRYGRTEQFRPAAELMAFIGRPLLVDPNADAVEAMTTTAFNVKASPEWNEWLGDYVREIRSTKAAAIDRALKELAARDGFRPPPPR